MTAAVEVVVVGSGPGGATTAALLAEAGREVLLLERGGHHALDSCEPFSPLEMRQKYRHGGISVALGKPSVAYAEGSCVGGGSEVNSGLYHRAPSEVLERWTREHGVADLRPEVLRPHFEAAEADLGVGLMPPGTLPAASLTLARGAHALGWHCQEVPRWYRYPADGAPVKQSMTQTLVPRALAAGARLLPGVQVTRLQRRAGLWQVHGRTDGQAPVALLARARHVFVCAGAVATPHLLRRSGLLAGSASPLHLHPTVKIVARFAEPVNGPGMGVPVHQVKQFSPRLSFGGSVSTPAHLRLALMDLPDGAPLVERHWRHMATYYAMAVAGRGSVRTLPLLRDPVVDYALGNAGVEDLLDGLELLGRCLFGAGAVALYPCIQGGGAVHTLGELRRLRFDLRKEHLRVMTIHLMGSCAMSGRAEDAPGTDSFGSVRGQPGLHINDASLMCTALGVNPQGTLMALARRNVAHFLQQGSVGGD
jgi:choline dehydrogenase-like flavoprotein